MKLRCTALLAPFLLALAACGSVGPDPGDESGDGADHRPDAGGEDGEEGSDGGGEPGDRPAVLSVSPADGATGVMPDAVITVRFDRAMDASSVEAAWSSEALPAAAVSFAWNPAGDRLTVTPVDLLPVAEGDGADPDAVEPATVAWAIGAGAEDAGGTALGEALEVEFATVRRLELAVPFYSLLTDSMAGSQQPTTGADTEYAGDTSGDDQVKVVVSFDLPALPDDAELVNAVLSATQNSATSNIFNVLGDLEAVHVRFAQLTGAFAAAPLANLGVFSASGGAGNRSLGVTGAVADDLADGATYSQFRLEFPVASDGDGAFDSLQLARSSLRLTLVYLTE